MAVKQAATQAAAGLEVALQKQRSDYGASTFSLGVQFAVGPGITVLFGASGAGKTTIFDYIAGLSRPDSGRVVADGVEWFDSLKRIDVPTRDREVGYLFQTLALFPHMSGRQNIEYGLSTLSRVEREERVLEITRSFGIVHVLDRRPREMSGGERQRVALARALVRRPRVLLLDEPLTALDAATKSRILDDLRLWIASHTIPVLYVTHDRSEVYALGNRVLVLEDGKTVADGLPQEVLAHPVQESVAQLAGFENVFDCAVIGLHAELGTMTCRVAPAGPALEVPMTRVGPKTSLKLGIRAGDILLATSRPAGISARNRIEGKILALRQQDLTVIAEVDCGAKFVVHLTPGARQSLSLDTGMAVWLVIKTYSCHVLQS